MADVTEPEVIAPRHKRPKIKPTDLVVFAIVIVVVIVLSATLVNKLTLKRNVSNARLVTDKVITYIQKDDGTAVRNLGSSKFRAAYSNDDLNKRFKAIELVTSSGAPTVDRQIYDAGDSKTGKTVLVVYKFPPKLAKQPYFIRVDVNDKAGPWQVVNISGSADESSLVN